MRKLSLSAHPRAFSLILTVAALLIAGASTAHAATRTWNGTNSGLWSDAGNWDAPPGAGDDLVFPGGATIGNFVTTNDLPAGTNYRSITVGGPYTLNGNAVAIDVGGLQFVNLGFPMFASTVNLPITLGADQTWTSNTVAANVATVAGAIDLGGHTLSFNTNWQLTVSGVISGTGAIVMAAGGAVLSGANTYAGQTTINAGTSFRIDSATALGVGDGTMANGTIVNGILVLANVAIANEAFLVNGSINGISTASSSSLSGPITLGSGNGFGSITINSALSGATPLGANLVRLTNSGNSFTSLKSSPSVIVAADQAIPGIHDFADVFFLSLEAVSQTIGNISGNSGRVDVAAGGVLNISGSGTNLFLGGFSGAGRIEFTGGGNFTFATSSSRFGPGIPIPSTFTGQFVVSTGQVKLDTNLPGNVIVDGNALLVMTQGSGAGALTANGGRVQLYSIYDPAAPPPSLYNPNPFHPRSGNVTLGSASTLEVIAPQPHLLSQLVVTGSVSLGNATLALQLPGDFAPTAGESFTLIDNDGTDPVIGTFKNLPEGALIVDGNKRFTISYVGGDGNDVVLTQPDYLLTEGATSSFFTTDLLIANPNDAAAPVHITFSNFIGAQTTMDASIAPKSQKLIRVNDVPGMAWQDFTTTVRSMDGLPIVVERTMSWDRSGYGAHTDHAQTSIAKNWFFAEGSQGFFHTYLLLGNPQPATNRVEVAYLRENEDILYRTYDLPPNSRTTIDAAAEPELANRSFGMSVTFQYGAGTAERAMYFGQTPLFNGGHESAGVTAPSKTWYLAEGATGPFFETFILLANPSFSLWADVDVTFLPAAGSPVTVHKILPAGRRLTLNIEQEAPSLANAAVSTQVVATQPILAERAQYWPDPAPNWYEAHNSPGLTSLGKKWGLAEGRVGNVDGFTNAQTFILLANPGTSTATVQIMFLRDNGLAPVTKTFTVDPGRRFNVHVAATDADVPELSNEHFGALVTSDQPIAVERAVYWDANGQIWAAGTNATGTPLP
jgi:hypothetical protein